MADTGTTDATSENSAEPSPIASPVRRRRPEFAPFASPLRFALLLGVLSVAGLVALASAVAIGSVTVPTGTVWEVVGHHLGLVEGSLDPVQDQIVWDLRVPRALMSWPTTGMPRAAGYPIVPMTRNYVLS